MYTNTRRWMHGYMKNMVHVHTYIIYLYLYLYLYLSIYLSIYIYICMYMVTLVESLPVRGPCACLCVCVCRMCGWIPPHAAAGMAALLQKRIFKFSYNRKPSDQIISQQVNFLWEGDRLGADVFF